MKVAIFYLVIPDDYKNRYPSEIVNDFTNVNHVLNLLSKLYNDSSENWYYVYAFTNNMKHAKIFEDTHDMSLFIRRDKNIPKHRYEAIREHNSYGEIILFNYDEDGNYIICTKGESTTMDDDAICYINEEIMESSLMHYEQFKDKYIKALDYLGYCTQCKCNREDEDNDYHYYQLSYGFSPAGFKYPAVQLLPNKPSLFIRHFALLLRKDKIKIHEDSI